MNSVPVSINVDLLFCHTFVFIILVICSYISETNHPSFILLVGMGPLGSLGRGRRREVMVQADGGGEKQKSLIAAYLVTSCYTFVVNVNLDISRAYL